MHRRSISNLICIVTLLSHSSADVIVSTLAGSGTTGYTDGIGTAASFNAPTGLTFDSSGVLYVTDRFNNRLRRVTSGGVVTTYAGGGSTTVTDSNGNPASFNQPNGLVFDSSGNLFIADLSNKIMKITPANRIFVFAGNGTTGYANGFGSSVMFNSPYMITIDSFGTVFVADWGDHTVRKITSSGVVSTLAGNGTSGSADGTGTSATFKYPVSPVVDSFGNVFVTDSNNHRVRRITPSGVVTTFAGSIAGHADGIGSSAQFNVPAGLAIDSSNNLYVSDQGNNMIRMVTPVGVVTTIAGNGTSGYADGDPSSAMFNWPNGVAVDSYGNIYVSEYYGHRIRVINMGNTPSTTTTSTITSTMTATANAPFYTSSPTKSGDTNPATIIAISVVIPIAFLVICASAIGIYMRFKRLGVTVVWYHKRPKLVVVDKNYKSAADR